MTQSLQNAATHRLNSLIAIALIAGSILGYASLFTDSLTNRVLGHPTLIKDLAAILAGGVVGLITSPLLVWICYGKNLRIALPIIYGLSLVVVVLATFIWHPLLAGALGIITLVGACLAVKLGMPRTVQRIKPGKCGWCGYDIVSGSSDCCPECGHDCNPDTMSLASQPNGPVLGEVRLQEFWMQTWPRRTCILAVLLFALAIGASRYSLPHFSPARYESVRVGMSLQDVRHLLGRPDRESVSPATNEQIWIYEQGGMAMGYCLIGFTDDEVTTTTMEGW